MAAKNSQNAKKGGPWMIDASLLIQAGIDPRTLKPIKVEGQGKLEGIRPLLRVLDEQNAVNSFEWYNLPCGLTGQELERMLYYKGQLCFFMLNESFYFMPYALDGTIDFYARYNSVKPVPWSSGEKNANEGETEERYKSQAETLGKLKLDVFYDVVSDASKLDLRKCCVLLHDYTKQYGQTIIPRSQLQDPLIKVEAEVLPMARTALLASTGTRGIRVNNAAESPNITAASRQIYNAVMSGELYIPMNGSTEFQDLTNKPASKAEEYLETMQALDNFRLSMHGVDNGGLFQKKSHKLEKEQEMNAAPTNTVLNDRLKIRRDFCAIANSLYGLGMWVDPAKGIYNAGDNTPEGTTSFERAREEEQ